jgi:hypothetical protein
MRRHLLGIVALVLILAGIIGMIVGYSSVRPWGMEDAAGVGLRTGLVLGALWIAYPQLVQLAKRFPKWLYAVIAMAASVVAFGPRSLIFIIPAILLLGALQVGAWLLKPLPKKKRAAKTHPPKKIKGERV